MLASTLWTLAATAATPARTTFRVVADMTQYPQPAGLWQFDPAHFYTVANGQTVLSVSTSGAVTAVFTPPSGHRIYILPVTAPNGRSYTVYSSQGTNYPISLADTSGSVRTYAPSGLGAAFVQGLPDGKLFGEGNSPSTDAPYLATGTEDGAVTPIYQFPAHQAILSPIYARDGNYYGVAWTGQGPQAGSSYVFRVTPTGAFTKIADLPNGAFGTGYGGSFFQADDGKFYGTTAALGANGTGTLYQVTPAGQYTVIYSFGAGATARPGTTFQASDGNFYGVTGGSTGPTSFGEIFQLTKRGQYTKLRLMKGSKDGACPCWLMQASDGVLYGTASVGGRGGGTIFALDAGLPKRAPQALSFAPQSGAPGTKVRIWGYNLFQASVQFNRVSASGAVSAGPNYVWATVPRGATSGPIAITTPGGTSNTAASFTVK